MHPMLCIMRLHLSAMYRSYIYIQGDIHTLTAAAIFRKLASERHTDIHNWPLQSFSQDYGLASHSTHVVYVNFFYTFVLGRLTSTPNYRFLRNFFMAGLFALRVFARNLLRGSRRRNIFHISFF